MAALSSEYRTQVGQEVLVFLVCRARIRWIADSPAKKAHVQARVALARCHRRENRYSVWNATGEDHMPDRRANLSRACDAARHEMVIADKRLLGIGQANNVFDFGDVASDRQPLAAMHVLAGPEQLVDPSRGLADVGVSRRGIRPTP